MRPYDVPVPDHQYLQVASRHLGKDRAREIVHEQLSVVLGSRIPSLDKDDPIPVPGRGPLPSFRALIAETQATGVPGPLQMMIDMGDPILGGINFTATTAEAITCTINIGNTSRSAPGPGYTAQACGELAADILAFRRGASAASWRSNVQWGEVGRCYRGLLFASAALVEAFLNRHLLAAQLAGVDITHVEEIGPFADRATAWMELFSPGSCASVKGSAAWAAHIELREERNAIIHARLPSLGVSLRELPRVFNAVKEGVGGLLCQLQRLRNGPLLGFMLQLRSAPEVSFSSFVPPAVG